MPDKGQPATGPTILEHVLQIEAKVNEISERLDEALAAVDRRYKLIDQFIDPALNIDGTLKQLISAYERQWKAFSDLNKAVHEELREARAAVAIHLNTEDLARENGA